MEVSVSECPSASLCFCPSMYTNSYFVPSIIPCQSLNFWAESNCGVIRLSMLKLRFVIYFLRMCDFCYSGSDTFHVLSCFMSLWLEILFHVEVLGSLSPQHGVFSGFRWRNGLQVWRLLANMLNKLLWRADKGWPPSLGFWRSAKNSSPLKLTVVRNILYCLRHGLLLWYNTSSEVGWGSMDMIDLAEDRNRLRLFVSAVMNFRVPWIAENFLTSWGPFSFWGRALLCGVGWLFN
jgi:hypothetical protein